MSEPKHYAFWPSGIDKKLEIASEPLQQNLIRSAQAYPEQTATVFYGAKLSYRQVLERAQSLAGYLQQDYGIEKGQRILLVMQNSPQFVIAYYAILLCGAVVVSVNPMNVTEELQYFIKDSEASCAICGQENTEKLLPLLGQTSLQHIISTAYSDYLPANCPYPLDRVFTEPSKDFPQPQVDSWSEALKAQHNLNPVSVASDDGCLLIYTSGSTGVPKGCFHTHRSINACLKPSALWIKTTSESVGLAAVPFFHITGMQHVMNTLIYSGGALVLLPRWNAETAATLIERHQCTHWVGVPAMVVDLVNNPKALSHDISSLQLILGGGAAMPEAVAAKLHDLCGVEYIEGYGLSESAGAALINPANRPKRNSLGIPWVNTEARIVDLDSLQPLADGQAGEIWISNPQLLQCYWNKEEETQKTLVHRDGKTWLRTGDLGHRDEEGYYLIRDRIKRMINSAGYKVWPAEVENTLYKHPAIQAACVISSPEERHGEIAKAVIVLKDSERQNASAEQIIEWARQHLAAYKVPHRIEFTEALPLTGTGKVNWRQLQELEWQKSETKT